MNITLTILFILGLISPREITAQEFEGRMKVIKQTLVDTVYFSYHIKGDLVRIDETDRKGNIELYKIIDLSLKTVTVVVPKDKIYTRENISKYGGDKLTDVDVIKSENHKAINGYECFQWRVRDNATATEVVYWVTEGDFVFFSDMVSVMQFADDTLMYFSCIKQADSYMPILVEEMSFLRQKFSETKVTDIKRESVNPGAFEIPTNYSLLKR